MSSSEDYGVVEARARDSQRRIDELIAQQRQRALSEILNRKRKIDEATEESPEQRQQRMKIEQVEAAMVAGTFDALTDDALLYVFDFLSPSRVLEFARKNKRIHDLYRQYIDVFLRRFHNVPMLDVWKQAYSADQEMRSRAAKYLAYLETHHFAQQPVLAFQGSDMRIRNIERRFLALYSVTPETVIKSTYHIQYMYRAEAHEHVCRVYREKQLRGDIVVSTNTAEFPAVLTRESFHAFIEQGTYAVFSLAYNIKSDRPIDVDMEEERRYGYQQKYAVISVVRGIVIQYIDVMLHFDQGCGPRMIECTEFDPQLHLPEVFHRVLRRVSLNPATNHVLVSSGTDGDMHRYTDITQRTELPIHDIYWWDGIENMMYWYGGLDFKFIRRGKFEFFIRAFDGIDDGDYDALAPELRNIIDNPRIFKTLDFEHDGTSSYKYFDRKGNDPHYMWLHEKRDHNGHNTVLFFEDLPERPNRRWLRENMLSDACPHVDSIRTKK